MSEPFVTYLELRESTQDGEAGAGLSHRSEGLVLLHVLELAASGEPRGAVTIVHDAGEHGGRYLGLARRLADRGWSVALPDLRGHGRSEGERGHSHGIREVLRDLGDVQDHLAYRQPEAPRVLVGQGLGALYCLAFASENPAGVAALVLASPLLEPRFVRPEPPGGFLRMLKKVGPNSPGRIGWKPEQLSSDPVERRSRSEDALVHDVVTLRAIEQAEAAGKTYRGRVAGLPMPTLLLQGDRDPIADPASARIAGPNVESRVLEGLAHDLFHEVRAEETVGVLLRWLDAKLPR